MVYILKTYIYNKDLHTVSYNWEISLFFGCKKHKMKLIFSQNSQNTKALTLDDWPNFNCWEKVIRINAF